MRPTPALAGCARLGATLLAWQPQPRLVPPGRRGRGIELATRPTTRPGCYCARMLAPGRRHPPSDGASTCPQRDEPDGGVAACRRRSRTQPAAVGKRSRARPVLRTGGRFQRAMPAAANFPRWHPGTHHPGGTATRSARADRQRLRTGWYGCWRVPLCRPQPTVRA
jgi:hypothetical protein